MTDDLAAWKRNRVLGGVLLMPVGVGLLIAGSALAWNATALLGFTVGSVGVLLIVLGALFIRHAVAGPFPARFGDDSVGVEEDVR